MKITEREIYRTAQQLRDEENEKLQVRPWNPRRRFNVPMWLLAMPAAMLIGFLLGLWTNSSMQVQEPLTALVDTVYVKVPVAQPVPDTVYVEVPAAKPAPDTVYVKVPVKQLPPAIAQHKSPAKTKAPSAVTSSSRHKVAEATVQPPEPVIMGPSIAEDNIQYDLLISS